jgi:hypothetical protein
MKNPLDQAIDEIVLHRYHNHRRESHSDIIANGIYRDLLARCPHVRRDDEAGTIQKWINVQAPGGRGRKIDLFVGEPQQDGAPDVAKIRIGIENKSVITAHRNTGERWTDLNDVARVIHEVTAEAVLVATVLVGVAERTLNVPDRVKPMCDPDRFETDVLPRLSSGDQALWDEFPFAVSINRRDDARKTVDRFRKLPRRNAAHTHQMGYDFVLIVPVHIDNVNPPYIARENTFGIDVDQEYAAMLDIMCRAYSARWHL